MTGNANDKGKNFKRKFRPRNRDRLRRARRIRQRANRSRSRSPRRFPLREPSPRRHSPFLRRERSPMRFLNSPMQNYHTDIPPSLDRSPNRGSGRYSPSDIYDREVSSTFTPTSHIPYGNSEQERNFDHVPVFEPPSEFVPRDELLLRNHQFGPGPSQNNERWERDDPVSEDSERRDFVHERFSEADNIWPLDRNSERSTFRENRADDISRNINDVPLIPSNEPTNSWTRNNTVQNFASPEEAHPLVPPFDGVTQDITSRQWVKVVDTIGADENWGFQEKRFQMLSKFTGPAREWLLKEPTFENESWGKLKRAFVQAFRSDMEFYLCLQKMMLRTKQVNETYSNYFAIKTTLLKNCNITGRKAVSCLIGGLANDELRNPAYQQNFPTIELLYNFLVQRSELARNSRNRHLNRPDKNSLQIENSEDFVVNQKHFIDVRINGFPLQGYNDVYSKHVTIREEQAPCLKLVHNKKNTIIKGYKGKTITSLGDVNALIRIDNLAINMRVYIVPNFLQDMVLVIGDSLRNHPDVRYEETSSGIPRFLHAFNMVKNSSFSMNEKLVRKMDDDDRKEPPNLNDSRFQSSQQSQRPHQLIDFFNPFSDAARLLNR